MKLILYILTLALTLASPLRAQEKQRIPDKYQGMSFKEFVSATQTLLKIKVFYKEEWVTGLKLGNYPGSSTLPEVLDNLFRGTSINYYFDKSGNVVLTKYYSVRFPDKPVEKETTFIPPTDYAGSVGNQQLTGNISLEIGNPAEKNKSGNVIISGYIRNKDTKEPVPGVTVFIQKLSAGLKIITCSTFLFRHTEI